MLTPCACSFSRLLSDEETLRVRQLLRTNGDAGVNPSFLGKIEHSSRKDKCPHRHQVGDDTGYCSYEPVLFDWLATLGEKAAVKNGAPL